MTPKDSISVTTVSRIYIIGVILITPVFFLTFPLDHQLFPRFLSVSIFLIWVTFLVLIKPSVYRLPTTDYRLPITGYRLPTTDYRLPTTDFRLPSMDMALTLLLIFYFINLSSLKWALVFSEAVTETQRVFIALVVFFFTLFFMKNSQGFEKQVTQVILILTLLSCTLGWFQLSKTSSFDVEELYTVTSFYAHKNLFSAMLLLFLPFLFNGLINFENKWHWLYGIGASIALIGIIILQTRATWMGIGVALGGILLLYFIKFSRQVSKKYFFLALATLLFLVSAVFVISFLKGDLPAITERINVSNYLQSKSGNERMQLWEKTICMFKEHKWLGVGAGNWQIFFPSCSVTGIWRVQNDNITFQRPHNDFLWILSEVGIVGFIPFILLLVLFFYLVLTNLYRRDPGKELFSTGIYACFLLGYLVLSFFDFPKERIEHLIISSTLAGILYSKLEKRGIFSENIKYHLPKSIILIPILVLMLFTVFFSVIRIRGEYLTKKMYKHKALFHWEKVIAFSDKAYSRFYTIDPTSIPLHWYRGLANFSEKNYEASLNDFKQAYKLSPYNHHVLNNLGSAYEMLGQREEAKKMYITAINISGYFDDAKLNLAVLFFKNGDYETALNWVNSVPGDNPRKMQYLKIMNSQMAKH